jgi:hypothetical protein
MTQTLQKPTIERLYNARAGILTTENGNKLFISYETIVGFMRDGREPVWTDGWRESNSTQDHIARWKRQYGGGRVAPERIFKERVRAIGFSAKFEEAPHKF